MRTLGLFIKQIKLRHTRRTEIIQHDACLSVAVTVLPDTLQRAYSRRYDIPCVLGRRKQLFRRHIGVVRLTDSKRGGFNKDRYMPAELSFAAKLLCCALCISGQISQTQAATKFNVAGASSVAKWLKVYKEQGEEGLRSLKVGTKRVSYMAEHPELIEAAEERSKEQRIHELERKVKRLELRIIYLQKLKALVR